MGENENRHRHMKINLFDIREWHSNDHTVQWLCRNHKTQNIGVNWFHVCLNHFWSRFFFIHYQTPGNIQFNEPRQLVIDNNSFDVIKRFIFASYVFFVMKLSISILNNNNYDYYIPHNWSSKILHDYHSIVLYSSLFLSQCEGHFHTISAKRHTYTQ